MIITSISVNGRPHSHSVFRCIVVPSLYPARIKQAKSVSFARFMVNRITVKTVLPNGHKWSINKNVRYVIIQF